MNWTHTSTAAVAAKKSGAPNTAKIRKTVINVIVHIFLAILAFIWVLPIFWVILTSFRGEKGSYVSTFFPKTYTFNNYIKLFTDTSILNFPKMFMNTFVIAIFTCIISTIFVLSVAYSMSRMRFKMRKPFMNIAMIIGLFPSFMSMIAVYYILRALNLADGAMIRVALIIVVPVYRRTSSSYSFRAPFRRRIPSQAASTPPRRKPVPAVIFRVYSTGHATSAIARMKPITITLILFIRPPSCRYGRELFLRYRRLVLYRIHKQKGQSDISGAGCCQQDAEDDAD